MLNKGEIILTDWNTAVDYMVEAMDACEAVGAYNSMFDFKKAIPFTEEYIQNLYSADFYSWENKQKKELTIFFPQSPLIENLI